MSKRICPIGVIVCCVSILACTHQRSQLATSQQIQNADVIVLSDSTEIDDSDIKNGPDNSLVVTIEGEERTIIAADIEAVLVLDHGRGAMEGFLIGGGIGFVLGAIIGASIGEEAATDDPFNEAAQDSFNLGISLVVGTGVGLVGGLLGGIVGGVSGSADEYKVSKATGLTIGPTSGGAEASWTVHF